MKLPGEHSAAGLWHRGLIVLDYIYYMDWAKKRDQELACELVLLLAVPQ